jgi:hypothetical protein
MPKRKKELDEMGERRERGKESDGELALKGLMQVKDIFIRSKIFDSH